MGGDRQPRGRREAGDRLVALLRGINVGRAKRVAMAELRQLVEGLGCRDVRTLLNSGNVVFRAPRLSPAQAAARIESALVTRLGIASRVTVIRSAELDRVVAQDPLSQAADDPSRYLVAFLRDPADRAKLLPLAKQNWGREKLALGERVAYLWCPSGVIAGRLFGALDKALGDGVTTRNWTTVLKLQALAGEGEGA
jgi:uncharacterized protein (DUF1697 family)